MTYVTSVEIETFMGLHHPDFMIGNQPMTKPQWISFTEENVPRVAQILHRYCNVLTFDLADAKSAVVEYQSGRGATNDDDKTSEYTDTDITFFLRQLYYTDGTHAAVVVEEDMNPKTSVPAWTTRTVRSALVAGDYEVITDRELTLVVFHNNIPLKGRTNVRFTYSTGYLSTSPEYQDLKLQVLRMCENLLLLKKKVQEAGSIRRHGVRDYSQMFDIFNESSILTTQVKESLERYRRFPFPYGTVSF